MTVQQWVAFEARDTIMVRDGRSFEAGADGTAEAVLPGPNTVAGAIFTAFGQREPEVVRGPVFAFREGADGPWQTLFPVPRTIVTTGAERDRLKLLEPRAIPGLVSDLAPTCPQSLCGQGETIDRYWMSGEALGRFLSGQSLPESIKQPDLVDRDYLLTPETRIGLARDPHRNARQGLLYQMGQHRPRDGFGLLAECDLGPDLAGRDPVGPTPLGGRGRLADVSIADGVSWPPVPPEYPEGQVLVYLATVAPWTTGWHIPVPQGAHLIAAAAGEPVPVATASPRLGWRRTRALRWGVPAGSVYLLRFDDGAEAARSWAHSAHGRAWGMDVGRATGDKLITAGFGVILTGVWS